MERNDALEQHLLTAVQKLCRLTNMLLFMTGLKTGQEVKQMLDFKTTF